MEINRELSAIVEKLDKLNADWEPAATKLAELDTALTL